MQLERDILNSPVFVPKREELSGIGVSYMAGIAMGLYDKNKIFTRIKRGGYIPEMNEETRQKKLAGWHNAVNILLKK